MPALPSSQERLGPRTWGAIIAACYGNKQWSKTLELWSEMRASGARPDGYLMQKVISACEKVGAWEEADMVRPQYMCLAQLCPTSLTSSVLFSSC